MVGFSNSNLDTSKRLLHIGHAMRKHVFGLMWTTKPDQPVHPRPQTVSMARKCPDVNDDVNPHILRMLEGTFSLDAAHMFFSTSVGVVSNYELIKLLYVLRQGKTEQFWVVNPGSEATTQRHMMFIKRRINVDTTL